MGKKNVAHVAASNRPFNGPLNCIVDIQSSPNQMPAIRLPIIVDLFSPIV